MIADAHEIREKQSSNRAHVINNVAIKGQTNADDSVRNERFFLNFKCSLGEKSLGNYSSFFMPLRTMMTVVER